MRKKKHSHTPILSPKKLDGSPRPRQIHALRQLLGPNNSAGPPRSIPTANPNESPRRAVKLQSIVLVVVLHLPNQNPIDPSNHLQEADQQQKKKTLTCLKNRRRNTADFFFKKKSLFLGKKCAVKERKKERSIDERLGYQLK